MATTEEHIVADDAEFNIGRLDGRMSALEGRVDRFEGVVYRQLELMDVKLDTISAQLAAHKGSLETRGTAWHWVLTALLALPGILYALAHVAK